MYNDTDIVIVIKFIYLGVVFTTGGSFAKTHETLSGQALKAIFELKSYVNKFAKLSVSPMMSRFDKLILNYGSEVCGMSKADPIERTRLQFCKHLLGVKVQTQSNFIYEEVGRVPLRNHRLISVVRYWCKILYCENTKYILNLYTT